MFKFDLKLHTVCAAVWFTTLRR